MTPQMLASCHHRLRPSAPSSGYVRIAAEGVGTARGGFDARMDFGLLRLRRGQARREVADKESLWVLLGGRARVEVGGVAARVARESLFEQGPTAIHAGRGERIEFRAETACEWALTRTRNSRRIGARLYRADEFTSEDRGAGLAQGACRRLVRTIFDYASRPEANLVAGEVVNYPGRWSTYPPHHHPQPEIYHYRFTQPAGYGHAEVGEQVLKVRPADTVLIPGCLDHSQVSAPGYGMYYLWVIRHLPGRPYRGFQFTAEHRWLLDPRRQGWIPPAERAGR